MGLYIYGSVHEAVFIHMGRKIGSWYFVYISLNIQIPFYVDMVQFAVVGDASNIVTDTRLDASVGTTRP